MKRIITLSFIFISIISFGQQANLFTIPNQSAQFIRMPSRGASTEIDAVFYNPAGLTKMDEGVYFSINNQILNQKTTVTSDYRFYTDGAKEYPGSVTSFIFPNFYAAYNKKKISIHGGFFLVGGAGGATYTNLPVSDRGIADIAPALQNSPGIGLYDLDNQILANTGTNPQFSDITDYRFNFENKGLGFSPSVQVGASYRFNDIFSASLGFRWARQVVQSKGFVTDIEIYNEHHGGWTAPGDYLRYIANQPYSEINSGLYNISADVYGDLGADRYIDVKETGSGITPIVGVNISPNDKWNIGLKYEHRTKTTMTTTVNNGKDGGLKYQPERDTLESTPVFVDGRKYRADLPGSISGGVSYQATDKWKINAGGRYMFLKQAVMNGREQYIDGGYYELEFATEYQVAEKFAVSGGYTYNRAAVNQGYHNDIDFWLPGHTIGLGGQVDVIDELSINFGGMFTKFKTSEFTYDNHYFADNHSIAEGPADYEPTYDMKFEKSAYIFVVGLDFSFTKGNNETTSNNNTSSQNEDIPYYYRAQ
ncbi:MAG: OmpP1/FadL family transporter [Chitinophagales bacterium]